MRRLASAALASMMCVAQVAAAEPAGGARPGRLRDALKGDARASFERASLLFSSRNFGPARAEFARAHDLSNEPRLLYNVAVCDKELGRYGRALAELRQSLLEGGSKLPADYRAAVRDTITLLEPLVTPLELDSDPPGATVLIDGESLGTTPLIPGLGSGGVFVDVGDHDVIVRRTGYVDLVSHVTAVGGHPVEIHAKLEPLLKRGRLVVEASARIPSGAVATVTVDGLDVGQAPWSGEIAAGAHVVVVRTAGLSAPPRQIEVSSGGRTELAFTLAPDARLRLAVDDRDAIVQLDGQDIGRGGFDGPVPSGEHRLKVARADGHGRSYEAEIALARSETRTMSIQLHRSGEVPTWVFVASGAGVVVAGTVIAVVFATKQTKFDGSGTGTLNPGVQPTSFPLMRF